MLGGGGDLHMVLWIQGDSEVVGTLKPYLHVLPAHTPGTSTTWWNFHKI